MEQDNYRRQKGEAEGMAEFRQWRETGRVNLKDVVPLDTPYNAALEISSFCNLKCVYCAHSINHGQYEGNMTDELLDKILHDLAEFPKKIKKVNLFGFGESLCHPGFPEIVGKVNRAGIADAVEFTTNGVLLTRNRIDRIMENGGVQTVRISLQGMDASAYKEFGGKNIDFGQFLSNLRYLYEHRGNMKVRMKVADIALKNVPDGEEKFKDMFGSMADSIYIEHILPIYAGMDYDSVDETIHKDVLDGRMHVHQERINRVCHRAFYRMRIRSNGDVTAACCDATQDVRYGNIQNKSLFDIWNGKKRKAFLELQLEGRRFEHSYCKECVMPNDIATKADLLDPWAGEILERMRTEDDE